MAYRVVPDRQGIIQIGKIKENLVTEVELPAPGFAGGSYAVLLRRPKEDTAYPVSSRHEGNALIWTVQTADTAIAGTGKLECRWYGDNGEVAKSQTYMVRITDGLPDSTEAPEAWEGFMGQVARNAQAAQTAAGEAKANADGAAASAGIAQGAAAEAGKQAGAAGDAANAAASAASAASVAQAGAETAAQNARAAAEAAETARSGAEAAKLAAGESATDAAGSAEAAAQAAQEGQNLYNQIKDDLAAGKLKGEKGEKGDPGKDAPQIDDGTISRDNPWSSRHIVETLCPALEESGNPVTCYPVAGYPLGVVARWEPTQAGEGDPSPENIRPISGWDSVKVERCGENLLQIAPFDTDVYKGVTFEYVPDGGVRIQGTASANVDSPTFPIRHLPPGKYYGLDMGTGIAASIVVQRSGNRLWLNAKGTFEIIKGDIVKYWYMIVNTGYTANKTVYPYIVPGTTAPTTYKPYIGSINTMTLPETVYGGDVDAVTGDGTENVKIITVDGDKIKFTGTGYYWNLPPHSVPGIGAGSAIWCSHFDSKRFIINTRYSFIFTSPGSMTGLFASADELSAYCASQHAAGTPVQIAYKLAQPVAFQVTGNAEIMPIPGEPNTIMTDADSVTITGRADPIRIIQQLQAAQSVATQQLAETQQDVVSTTAMAVDYIYEQDSKIFGGEDDDDQTDAMPT